MTNNLTSTIDALGSIKAQIAELEQKEKQLKAVIVEQGAGAYEGNLFRVTVAVSERETLDMKAVREKLSPQFIAAHTKVAEVISVRVCARNGLKVAA
jgi:hypothetical protein